MESDQSQKNQFNELQLTTTEASELADQLKEQMKEGNMPKADLKKINLIIAGLGDGRGLIRRTFSESLGLIGKDALPGLLEVLLNSKNVTARRAAAKTLKLVGDPSALPYLLQALMTDSDPVVQGSSAGAMAIFGEDAIDHLLKVLINPKSSAMQCGLATWALAFASTEAPNSLKIITRSENTIIRTAAIGALGSQSQLLKDDQMKKILINALDDSAPEVRAEATRLINNIGNKDLIENLLIQKLNDKDLLVRKNAAISLMTINSMKSIEKLKEIVSLEKDQSIIEILKLAIQKITKNSNN